MPESDTDLRDLLADSWTEAGLAEHASIASFDRFSMQLLAVGAPPDLLREAHRAALDEIRHTEACFERASHYAGEDLAPGPLPLDGDVLGPLDLRSVMLATVAEGCVGETLAAMEAEICAGSCLEGRDQQVMLGIAKDEARHAALAWRFVQWGLEQDPGLMATVTTGLHLAVGPQSPEPPEHPREADLLAHGRPTERLRNRVREQYRGHVLPVLLAELQSRHTS